MNIDITPFDLGWLVGFYEGEGSCGLILKKNNGVVCKVTICLTFTQKDVESLVRVQAILGVSGSLRKQTKGGISRLVFSAAQARAILQLLQPHLSWRRQLQIQEAMDIWNNRPERGRRHRRTKVIASAGQMTLIG